MIDNIVEQLKRDEGLRLTPYKDSRGYLTVYYGHNLESDPLPQAVIDAANEATASVVLLADVAKIQHRLFTDLPWVQTLPLVIQGALTNMSFNMGVDGLLQFKHTLAAVQRGDYAAAATGMEQSAWYEQVGDRAKRLVQQVRTQEWV